MKFEESTRIIFILFKGDESPNDDDNNIEDHKRLDLSLLDINWFQNSI